MLKDATGFNHVYIAAGKTDLRKCQDGFVLLTKRLLRGRFQY